MCIALTIRPRGGGDAPDGRKVKSTIHWVSAQHAIPAEVRLYEQLFTVENPDMGEDVNTILNPHSLEVLPTCFLEPGLASAQPGDKFQFERTGYFCATWIPPPNTWSSIAP